MSTACWDNCSSLALYSCSCSDTRRCSSVIALVMDVDACSNFSPSALTVVAVILDTWIALAQMYVA